MRSDIYSGERPCTALNVITWLSVVLIKTNRYFNYFFGWWSLDLQSTIFGLKPKKQLGSSNLRVFVCLFVCSFFYRHRISFSLALIALNIL